jgi:hypothetical protein
VDSVLFIDVTFKISFGLGRVRGRERGPARLACVNAETKDVARGTPQLRALHHPERTVRSAPLIVTWYGAGEPASAAMLF